MPSKTVKVGSSVGLHARPAAVIAEAVSDAGVPVTLAVPGGDPVDAGSALMGIGFSTSDNRAREAAERALRSPLIGQQILGAKGILLSIAGGEDLSLYEVNEAAEVIRQAATDDTNIIFGATVDDRLTGQVWVTVVATGFGMSGARQRVFGERPLREDTLEPPSFLQT
jgi:phosphotransferase system HPr (HPr) family protein